MTPEPKYRRVNFTDRSKPFVEKAPSREGPWEKDDTLTVGPSGTGKIGDKFVSEPEVASIPVTGSDTPSQGADLSSPEFELLWAKIRHEHDALPAPAREWVNRLSREAMQANVSFHTRTVQTERSYHLCKALVTLAAGGADKDIATVLMEQILGFPFPRTYKTLGHAVGRLNHVEAEHLAILADEWAAPPPAPKDAA